MTPSDLIADLRSRINPAYAAQLGTESYERRLCAEALESLLADTAALRAFAQAVMDTWPGGDIDGGALQEIAENHGILKPETRHEPCRKGCCCDENADSQEWAFGVVCYRKTPLLTGSNAIGQRGAEGASSGNGPVERRVMPAAWVKYEVGAMPHFVPVINGTVTFNCSAIEALKYEPLYAVPDDAKWGKAGGMQFVRSRLVLL